MSTIAISILIALFIIGYLAIIFEFYVRVNKTAVGIAMAGVLWMVYFLSGGVANPSSHLSHHLSEVSQIIFFLIGAMTLVELIDSHKGFNTVIRLIHTASKRKMLIIISFLAFFLSAVLDNLTTTILMISVLRKLVPEKSERLTLNCMIVIAANAGGAWTPIGDVTTTMLWINHRVSTLAVISEVFIPSLISMLVPLGIFTFFTKGEYVCEGNVCLTEKAEPGAALVFSLGIFSLLMVPVIKWATGLPPFMGMLIALSFLWFVTDLIHFKHDDRHHLRVPFILTKIDVSSVLFFMGILLSINALEVVGLLKSVAIWLDSITSSHLAIATFIGLVSAIVDNIPLVAASMGMYDVASYGLDNPFWMMIAYTAGTGGSLLSIGSAAGVALMGIEKVDFISYMKKATIPAFLGYILGVFYFMFI
ncbi:MAG: Na(+)/H(+) antiporter NhaD [Chlamydiia bacterium]|nr:Na(+)/H(+) antiporter NhaD [Chlamydiia bacterium]MCH9618893.1 Na(+)/H(+) antiporter NhaD [Chlamydiia bacterium]MCH9624560.1 Na(+)/H(+) antiporter NhaD [Chlamydiia bacterium]